MQGCITIRWKQKFLIKTCMNFLNYEIGAQIDSVTDVQTHTSC